LLIGLLFIYLFPHLTQKGIGLIESKGGKIALIGFITMISTPIIIVILLISIVGIPFGVGLLFIYLTLYYLATFPVTTLIGSLVMSVFKKEAPLSFFLYLAIIQAYAIKIFH
jgi:ACR3 family arsenite efflux pump ArsB